MRVGLIDVDSHHFPNLALMMSKPRYIWWEKGENR